MKDLIEALVIFDKYIISGQVPAYCEHGIFMVCYPKEISAEDTKRLSELSFNWDDARECYTSYRFGNFK